MPVCLGTKVQPHSTSRNPPPKSLNYFISWKFHLAVAIKFPLSSVVLISFGLSPYTYKISFKVLVLLKQFKFVWKSEKGFSKKRISRNGGCWKSVLYVWWRWFPWQDLPMHQLPQPLPTLVCLDHLSLYIWFSVSIY